MAHIHRAFRQAESRLAVKEKGTEGGTESLICRLQYLIALPCFDF
jgi:hypothetical protein